MPWPSPLLTLCGVATLSACFSTSNEARVKSGNYSFATPPPPWHRVDAGAGDVAFQNPRDRASISLNSVCGQYQDLSLEELRKGVPLGLDSAQETARDLLQVDGIPAIRTRTDGVLNGVPVRVTLTVLRGRDCVFDILLASKSEIHALHEATYAAFLAGFRDGGKP